MNIGGGFNTDILIGDPRLDIEPPDYGPFDRENWVAKCACCGGLFATTRDLEDHQAEDRDE